MGEVAKDVAEEGIEDDVTVLSEGWDEATDNGVVRDGHLRTKALTDPANVSLTTICKGMVNDGTDALLTESELELIKTATVSTKQYERNKKGI
jgi:hypothetical protein